MPAGVQHNPVVREPGLSAGPLKVLVRTDQEWILYDSRRPAGDRTVYHPLLDRVRHTYIDMERNRSNPKLHQETYLELCELMSWIELDMVT